MPRARSPLLEEPSSIDEDMEIPPSREDQDQGSLIDDEEFSNIDEEDVKRRDNSAIPSRGYPSPHGDGKGSILPNPLHISIEGDKNMHKTLPR